MIWCYWRQSPSNNSKVQEDILLNAFCATRIGRGWCGRSPSTPLVSVVALALVKMRGSCACNISYWTLYSQREGKEANVDYLTLILLRGWTSMNRGVCKYQTENYWTIWKHHPTANRAFLFGTGFRLCRVMQLAMFLSLIDCVQWGVSLVIFCKLSVWSKNRKVSSAHRRWLLLPAQDELL